MLFTLADARKLREWRHCHDLLKVAIERAYPLADPERVSFSIGDVAAVSFPAASIGYALAFLSMVKDRRIVVSAALPSIKRAVADAGDSRFGRAIAALEKWTGGDGPEPMTFVSIPMVSRASSAVSAARAVNRAVELATCRPMAVRYYLFSAMSEAAGFGGGRAEERFRQRDDLIALFPRTF